MATPARSKRFYRIGVVLLVLAVILAVIYWSVAGNDNLVESKGPDYAGIGSLITAIAGLLSVIFGFILAMRAKKAS